MLTSSTFPPHRPRLLALLDFAAGCSGRNECSHPREGSNSATNRTPPVGETPSSTVAASAKFAGADASFVRKHPQVARFQNTPPRLRRAAYSNLAGCALHSMQLACLMMSKPNDKEESMDLKIDKEFPVPCPNCSESEFSHSGSLEDDTLVTCTTCGFSTVFADIKEHGVAKAKQHIAKQVKDAVEKELKRIFK